MVELRRSTRLATQKRVEREEEVDAMKDLKKKKKMEKNSTSKASKSSEGKVNGKSSKEKVSNGVTKMNSNGKGTEKVKDAKEKKGSTDEKNVKEKKVSTEEKEVKDKKASTDEKESKEKKDEPSVKELEVGDEVPDFELKNQNNETISLKKVMEENRIVVIFAYPKANTPGCTRQACGMRDNYNDLKKYAVVFGISADSVSAQKSFQEKQNLPYDLLSDKNRELIGALGCKKTPTSGIIRSHFIIVNGKLKFKRVKISPEVSVSDCKKEVLEISKSESDVKEERTAPTK
ncbi:hypothetical protein TBLA_0A00940 [Henningerozyma blattae CBS 6284]|uniref:thioredoxin-dependent peroxiredoxin n=1 Tax=Henningerozyma blattae (strain ATCC 34711 / CBS 6284 / DSM 70876 / NBRC 10599 / NRRL Y-10934 / UCD 77-7) TaxID=1071380 RepID=I2GUU2_HENB6|nr:hypothetical protein TBLA_0A00940 [Tetrapisispora blattae CBS 6284]CCH57894.1 hypothetical protein TBLA_0A00940 [Tetrapisispora blattae CBS 6284]